MSGNRMYKTLIVLFCSLLTFPSFGQVEDEVQRLYDEGLFFFYESNYEGAVLKWEQGLRIARERGRKHDIADFAVRLGNLYNDIAEYSKAIPYFEEALKIHKEFEYIDGMIMDLTNLAIASGELGDYPTAIDFFEEAAQVYRKIDDKAGEASCLKDIGYAYRLQFDYSKAADYYEEALKIYRESEDEEGIAGILTALGIVYDYLHDHSRAIAASEEAIKYHGEAGDKMGIVQSLSNSAGLYSSLGEYPKAIARYEEALEISRELDDKLGIGANLIGIGVVLFDLGEYTKAISFHEEAETVFREIGDDTGISNCLNNLGNVYSILGDYSKATVYYENALKIQRATGDQEGMAKTLNNLGSVVTLRGDYPKAILYFEEALKNYTAVGRSTTPTELNIADIWLLEGKTEEAEETYKRLGDPIRLGTLSLNRQNYDEALSFFHTALENYRETRNAIYLYDTHTSLGQAYECLHEDSLAFVHYREAIELAEAQREGLGDNEKSRFFAAEPGLSKRIVPYEGQIRVLMALEEFWQAFFYSENLKARVLAEAMARRHGIQEVGLPAEWLSFEDSLDTRIRGIRRQMEILYKNDAMELYAEKEAQLKQVKTRQQNFIRELRTSYPEYAAVHYPQAIYPSEVILEPDEAMFAYEVTDQAVFIFLLQEDRYRILLADITREALEERVRRYRSYFVDIQNIDQLIGYNPRDGHELYSLLFSNLLEDIPNETRLIIVPDEILGTLPFETLVTDLPEEEKIREGEHGPYPAGVMYLSDKYKVSYAQSATSLTLLRTLRKGKAEERVMFVLADPIFDEKDGRIETLIQKETVVKGTEAMHDAISDWRKLNLCGPSLIQEDEEADTNHTVFFSRLTETNELAKKIRQEFGNKTTILMGKDAREDHIYRFPLSEYRYLTFATHGILDKTVPYIQEPALVMTQVNNPDTCDGFLTMSEVMGLDLQADVVALTACETGLGENVSGEGVMGMGRAFQYAGARNVFVSLWSVAEASSTELTMAFFRHIKNGREPVDAIQLARREIRDRGYEHPFYWGAFILFGE